MEDVYQHLSTVSLSGEALPHEEALAVLTSPEIEILPLLEAAYKVRFHYWGRDVTIHVINNAQNGWCPEDCGYCAQAKSSSADIEEYPLKPEAEILEEAKRAYRSGAYRYCMVFSGRGPSKKRIERLAHLVKTIKAHYPIQVCVSCGLLDENGARILKEAGLDRLNHNLNTSETRYGTICTTHTYQDRLNTLSAAQKAGLALCSGMIVGLGESPREIVEIAYTLRDKQTQSIPINFLIPIPGVTLEAKSYLTPLYCLRILALFRFLNPKAEIRIAAGREYHLRSLQAWALYPASSLFMEGYLNTKGTNTLETLQMIEDAGFKVRASADAAALLASLKNHKNTSMDVLDDAETGVIFKELKDLRPFQESLRRDSSYSSC